MTETYAYFWIEGFPESPEAISATPRLQPTETKLKGDLLRAGRVRERNCWEPHSPLSRDNLFLEVHIAAVIGLLEPRKDALFSLQGRGLDMGINCVGYYESGPGISLTPDLLARCAALRLGIDFDLYCTGPDSD
jgi:hypothetical protein